MPTEDDLRVAELRLVEAQLHSDVPVLEELIEGSARFTDPAGALWTKADDLDAHRTGQTRLSTLELITLDVRVIESTGVTWLLAQVAGYAGDGPFEATVRYTRCWHHTAEGWRVVAAHASICA